MPLAYQGPRISREYTLNIDVLCTQMYPVRKCAPNTTLVNDYSPLFYERTIRQIVPLKMRENTRTCDLTDIHYQVVALRLFEWVIAFSL
jgi:hypothetical protein